MVAHPVLEWTPSVQSEVTCHVTPSILPLFHEHKETKPQRQARLTGGTVLYMNYSIILQKLVSIQKLQITK